MKKKIKGFFRKNREAMNSHAGKIGGYSFILTLVVLAILIAVNVMVRLLPSSYTQFDISSARLYSLTSNTKMVVNNLKDKVTIYWITQSGKEDETMERLLNVYDALSDNVEVVKKNPDVYPTFASQYTDETVDNNSLIVECGERNRYIPYSDIYVQDYSDTYSYYSQGQNVSTSFDGEGQITSAINYVTTEDLPKIYLLTGHEEAELSDSFTKVLNKQNVETEEFTLLNTETIPEDCDGILINSPARDISEKEVELLQKYLDDGGHLMVFSATQEETKLTNLNSLLTTYHVKSNEGVVIEGDADSYVVSMPYLILANKDASDITDPLIDNKSNIVVPIARGYTLGQDEDGVTVTSLLSTSDQAYSKVEGYNIQTYEKEDGDIDGPFSIAFSIDDTNHNSKIVWVGSDHMMDDTYDSYSSGANSDFVMNAISWMVDQKDSISIRSKSMDYTYLSISDSQANIIKICLIGIIPALYLLNGVDIVLHRRKKNVQNRPNH